MLAPLRLIKKKRLCTIVRRNKRIRVSYRQFFPVWVDGPRPVHARRIRAFNMRRGCSAAYALCLPCASAWKRRLLDSRLGSCRADWWFFSHRRSLFSVLLQLDDHGGSGSGVEPREAVLTALFPRLADQMRPSPGSPNICDAERRS